MTVADDHLARIGAGLDEWDREDAALASDFDERLPDCAREVLALSEALQPVIAVAIKLGAGPAPGADADEDASWAASVALARREVLAQQTAGIDHGLGAVNLRLLDRIDVLLGTSPEDDWDDVACHRVQELVDARHRGRQRGRALRQSRQDIEPEDRVTIGWLLRHPTDHWLRLAAPKVSESPVPGTDRGPDRKARARLPATVRPGLERSGGAGRRDLRDGGARWLTCARVRNDGTLLPLDGTRRCAVPNL